MSMLGVLLGNLGYFGYPGYVGSWHSSSTGADLRAEQSSTGPTEHSGEHLDRSEQVYERWAVTARHRSMGTPLGSAPNLRARPIDWVFVTITITDQH